MRIALAGNPNSGKTTMYNALTGKNEKVGNWAGVTVDKKESPVKKNIYQSDGEIIAVDLPGAYSMSPFTAEESITSEYVKREAPDAIINIVDATNLSRSLFFTTQLLELGVPVVVALNKSDLNKKKKTKIDVSLLSEKLGCPVVETISTDLIRDDLEEVIKKAVASVGRKQTSPYIHGDVDMSDVDAVKNADKARFDFVNTIVSEVETRRVFTKDRNIDDKIDAILTNKWLGIPIFALVMYAVFWISQSDSGLGVLVADALVGWLEAGQEYVRELVSGTPDIIEALLVDGIIGGVIAVIGFLPLVMVMYFFIALLEDCGYMARVSVVLDPIFKKVGLSGKSVIAFVVGVGCAVPGVMACRTIRNERERRATAMLAPFMPCGAKIPVISLFAGAFFDNAPWVSTLMYLSAIVIIFIGALLVNSIAGHKPKHSYFIIELPEYKLPSLWRAFTSMCSRGWAFVVKAATVILLCNTAVQIMQTFDWSFRIAETADSSILASIAGPFAYLIFPIVGVLSWQLAAATITGFIAKENIVGTLAVCFVGLENLIDTESLELMQGAGADVATVFAITKAAALAYMMFNLFSPPCFAAIGAMASELKSGKWLAAGIGLELGIGYTVAYCVYTVGSLVTGEKISVTGAVAGLAAVLAFVLVLAGLIIKAKKESKA